MKKPIYFLALLSLAVAGCETLVNDVDPSRLPKSDNKLVIHGYLAPQDTLLEIIVGFSNPVIGSDLGFFRDNLVSIPNATVTLSNQNRSVNLVLDPKLRNYVVRASNMPILAGQTYNLKVTFNNLSVESSCTIPRAVAIKEVREDSVAAQSFGGQPNVNRPKDRTYRIFWQDPAGQADYYRVSGYLYQVQRFQTGMNQFQEHPQIDPISFRTGSQTGDLYADTGKDGTLMASAIGRLNNFWFGNNVSILPNTRRIQLSLIACEKAYYDYHRLVDSFDGDNPFAEPTLIPSNIKGGLGCFAGYNRTDFVVKTR